MLDALANSLCPSYFPPGQECTLPLKPGQYGSLVGGPTDITFGDLPDILSKLSFKLAIRIKFVAQFSIVIMKGKVQPEERLGSKLVFCKSMQRAQAIKMQQTGFSV
jgi:hypothetical protein